MYNSLNPTWTLTSCDSEFQKLMTCQIKIVCQIFQSNKSAFATTTARNRPYISFVLF